MSSISQTQKPTPEERVLRSMYRTKKSGLTPSSNPRGYGTVVEDLIINELQALSHTADPKATLRFARGRITGDYGTQKHPGASAKHASRAAETSSPKFDIVCYDGGDVAWEVQGETPYALIPASFVKGVIEVKRTLSPSSFTPGTSKDINPQLERYQAYMDEVGCGDAPFVLIGAHHWSTSAEKVRDLAAVEHVVFIGDIRKKKVRKGVEAMAEDRALEQILSLLG